MSNKISILFQKPATVVAGFCLCVLVMLGLSFAKPVPEIRFPAGLFVKNSTEFYDGDTAHIKYDGTGMQMIDYMYNLLTRNPTIILEVSSHCSHEEKNPDILSQKRGERVKELLVKKGIDPARLVIKGYGIKKLKVSDAVIAKAKTPAEKEALRQQNRRVVFRILSWEYPAKNVSDSSNVKQAPEPR
jgi:outer membrane protein OmpA-like peptidoglycan-associated protein